MKNAKEIYDDLINRIQEKIRKEISRVYDPTTGIQKSFLKGKLLSVKQIRLPENVKKPPPNSTNQG